MSKCHGTRRRDRLENRWLRTARGPAGKVFVCRSSRLLSRRRPARTPLGAAGRVCWVGRKSWPHIQSPAPRPLRGRLVLPALGAPKTLGPPIHYYSFPFPFTKREECEASGLPSWQGQPHWPAALATATTCKVSASHSARFVSLRRGPSDAEVASARGQSPAKCNYSSGPALARVWPPALGGQTRFRTQITNVSAGFCIGMLSPPPPLPSSPSGRRQPPRGSDGSDCQKWLFCSRPEDNLGNCSTHNAFGAPKPEPLLGSHSKRAERIDLKVARWPRRRDKPAARLRNNSAGARFVGDTQLGH